MDDITVKRDRRGRRDRRRAQAASVSSRARRTWPRPAASRSSAGSSARSQSPRTSSRTRTTTSPSSRSSSRFRKTSCSSRASTSCVETARRAARAAGAPEARNSSSGRDSTSERVCGARRPPARPVQRRAATPAPGPLPRALPRLLDRLPPLARATRSRRGSTSRFTSTARYRTCRFRSSSRRSSRSRARGTTASANASSRCTGRSAAPRSPTSTRNAFPTTTRPRPDVYLALLDVEQFETPRGRRAVRRRSPERARQGSEPHAQSGSTRPAGKVVLSDFVPILENLGLTVIEEVPTRLNLEDGEAFLHDFGVLGRGRAAARSDEVRRPRRRGDLGSLARRDRVGLPRPARDRWPGSPGARSRSCAHTERIGFVWARAFTASSTRTRRSRAIRRSHGSSCELFELPLRARRRARHDGRAGVASRDPEPTSTVSSLSTRIASFVPQLGLVEATLRTNAYRPGRRYLSFKFESARVPDMPKPAPLFEIFVYSTDMEGIHLRGGKVARGGIRWSDRKEDYRREVLGLMKAQMVKNAVIVPVGSKGGFVLKRPPDDREQLRADVAEQYSTLMRGMLDVTDNLVGGEVVHPPDVRVLDENDPYLVVAADKGTATFSDLANGIAAEYGFWLGDAFASGGSDGYDHKELGITAKGAWESVKRHFRELGHDVMTEPFTVVGIGDMSGDVFGNGMLLHRPDQARGRVRPPPRLRRSRILTRRRRSPSASGSSSCPARRGTTTSARRSPRAAESGLAPRRASIPPPRPAPPSGSSAKARCLRTISWRRSSARRSTSSGTAASGRSSRRRTRRTRTSATGRTTRSASAARDLRVRVVGEGGNLGFTQNGANRVRGRRGQDQHGRDRQLGRRRLLRPRGQPQDPARDSRRERRSDVEAAKRPPARGRAGRRQARALRQLPPGADPLPGGRGVGRPSRVLRGSDGLARG